MKILVIEDEKELSNSICQYLTIDNFYCEAVFDFEKAIKKIRLNDYSCIVLDICLPNGSGLDILKELKASNKEDGVLIISAKNSLDDKIVGLHLGADDYLVKPFYLAELGARVHAIIRRKSFSGKNQIMIGPLTLDVKSKTLKNKDRIIELTHKEFDLLSFFISNKNKVITKDAIVEHLWGNNNIYMVTNYDFIYTHVKNVRRKLMSEGCSDFIKVVYGMGYRFELA
jgi:DNA-binding response OmpR family regulator